MNIQRLFFVAMGAVLTSFMAHASEVSNSCDQTRARILGEIRGECQLPKFSNSDRGTFEKSVIASYLVNSTKSPSEFGRNFSLVDSDNIKRSYCIVSLFTRHDLEDANSFIYNNSGTVYQPDWEFALNVVKTYPNWRAQNKFSSDVENCFKIEDAGLIKELL